MPPTSRSPARSAKVEVRRDPPFAAGKHEPRAQDCDAGFVAAMGLPGDGGGACRGQESRRKQS
jgi:hypothetical protein